MRVRTLVTAVLVAAVLFPVEASAQRWRRGRSSNTALGIGLGALAAGLILSNEAKQQRRESERAAAAAAYYGRPRGYYPRGRTYSESYYARDAYGNPVVVREYVRSQPRVVREVRPAYYYNY